MEYPGWAFAWFRPRGKEYITTIIGWTRAQVRGEAMQTLGEPWQKIFNRGGRIVKITIVVKRDK